jgi:hypothetical protein
MPPLVSSPAPTARCAHCRNPALFALRGRGTYCSLHCLEIDRRHPSPSDQLEVAGWLAAEVRLPAGLPEPVLPPPSGHSPVSRAPRGALCRACRHAAEFRVGTGNRLFCSLHCLTARGARPLERESVEQWYARLAIRRAKARKREAAQRAAEKAARVAEQTRAREARARAVREDAPIVGGALVGLSTSVHGESRPIYLTPDAGETGRTLTGGWHIETAPEADVLEAERRVFGRPVD